MTHAMAKGADRRLTAPTVRAVLQWRAWPGAPDVDAAALLLGADGKVRSDADFVFYNQPRHPSGLVRHRPKQRARAGNEVADVIEIELAELPAEVERVVLAGSTDAEGFAVITDLRLLLRAGERLLAQFPLDDCGNATALIAGELRRHAGGWTFRALGEGHPDGLGGLATAYGVAVEAPPGSPEPQQEPQPQPQPQPRREPEPEEYALAPAAPRPPQPAQPAVQPAVPQPAAPRAVPPQPELPLQGPQFQRR